MKTHGEQYVFNKSHIDFKKDIDDIARSLVSLPKRMKRNEALKYYGLKIEQVFINPKDFLKPNDFFDYFEAKRIYDEIQIKQRRGSKKDFGLFV